MRYFLILAAFLLSFPALADISVEQATTIPSGETASSAGIFMIITNTGDVDDALVAVRSAVAGRGEIHTMEINKHGVMAMRPIATLKIPAKTTLKLTPSSEHVMLKDLSATLALKESFPVTLTFAKAGDRQVGVEVVTPEALSRRFPLELSEHNAKKLNINPDETWWDRLRHKFGGSKPDAAEPEAAAPDHAHH